MQFETRYSYDFVKRFLPPKGGRILEIGCGAGELAACLFKDGYEVVAIDSDCDSIAVAQSRGVRVPSITFIPSMNRLHARRKA